MARFGWWLMAVLALTIGIVASRYLTLDPDVFFPEQRDVYQDNLVVLAMHISGGIVALVLGPTQFWAGFRHRSLRWHRALGVAYAVAVAVGVLGGFPLAWMAYGGGVAQAGFTSLALGWAICTGTAVVAIARGQVSVHRQFMIRSYALTFAAVTLRLWQGVFGATGVPFDIAYPIVAWLAWVPNLALVETYLARERRRLAVTRQRGAQPPLRSPRVS
jgi:uncharacterized membrane protein